MANEGKKKVKTNAPSSLKYLTSDKNTLSSDDNVFGDDDDSLPSELLKNSKAMIKGLMKQVGDKDEILKQQE
jgi:hypothetical protein